MMIRALGALLLVASLAAPPAYARPVAQGPSYFAIAHVMSHVPGPQADAKAKPFLGKHVVWTGWVRGFRQRKSDKQYEVMLNMSAKPHGEVYPVLIVLPPASGQHITKLGQKVRFSATIIGVKTDFGFLSLDFKNTQLL